MQQDFNDARLETNISSVTGFLSYLRNCQTFCSVLFFFIIYIVLFYFEKDDQFSPAGKFYSNVTFLKRASATVGLKGRADLHRLHAAEPSAAVKRSRSVSTRHLRYLRAQTDKTTAHYASAG